MCASTGADWGQPTHCVEHFQKQSNRLKGCNGKERKGKERHLYQLHVQCKSMEDENKRAYHQLHFFFFFFISFFFFFTLMILLFFISLSRSISVYSQVEPIACNVCLFFTCLLPLIYSSSFSSSFLYCTLLLTLLAARMVSKMIPTIDWCHLAGLTVSWSFSTVITLQ